ncbi:MAG: PHP domain-containing protein [Thermoplasmata archaeon]
MKFDLHVHSKHSKDSNSEPLDVIRRAESLGLDGIAFLDHNSTGAYIESQKIETDLIIVPGEEISTPYGHIAQLGIKKSVGPRDSVAQAIKIIRKEGGIAVAVHPYRYWSGIGEKVFFENSWTAVEGLNGRTKKRENKKARKLAEKAALPVVGGSDSHDVITVGQAYTVLPDVSGWRGVIREIKNGNTDVDGLDRTSFQTYSYVKKAVTEWIKRGFKRM